MFKVHSSLRYTNFIESPLVWMTMLSYLLDFITKIYIDESVLKHNIWSLYQNSSFTGKSSFNGLVWSTYHCPKQVFCWVISALYMAILKWIASSVCKSLTNSCIFHFRSLKYLFYYITIIIYYYYCYSIITIIGIMSNYYHDQRFII